MLEKTDITKNYKTQWKAYFKPGFGSPTIVYGESEHEARCNALAFFRKNQGLVDFRKLDEIVSHVDWIG